MDFEIIFDLVADASLTIFIMAAKRPAQDLLVDDEPELEQAPTALKKPRRGRPPGSSKKKKSSGKPSGIMNCAGPHSFVSSGHC